MIERSAAEIAAFLLAFAASLFFFWRRFRVVLRTITCSKPDADFRLAPLARRLRRLLLDVLLQTKVIRERPWPGLAHALVFWGFCAFSLVTLDHLAGGLVRLDHGPLAAFYFGLAFLFALAIAVSILGLFIRRFFVRPKWLGDKASPESGVIALLIFILMATYIAEYIGHPAPDSIGGRFLWWSHTLALLVFLPLIPHTKHLHLVLSPFSVFFSRGSFSKIPPLSGDDDFGLDTGADVTRIAALQAYSCVECGRCMEHCPAYHTGKILNPKEIALGFRSFLNENGPASEAPVLGVHLSEEAVFQCTTCGACEYQCPVGVEHLPLIIGLRRGAVNTGKWEDPRGSELFLKLERSGNPFGLPQLERDRFIQKNSLPWFDGSRDYCLWLGCMGAYDPQGRQIILALAGLLRYLGITFGVLRKEKCTGDAARRLGNDLAFEQLAAFNIEQLRAANVRRLLSICPHCVRTIGEDWREFGAEFQVEHHSTFLARHLPQPTAGTRRISFHDPCYLSRYKNICSEPRAVAAASGRLIEPPRSRQKSFCCGAGGGLTFLGEEKGARISHARARELLDTGADTIAVACPFCHSMLRDAVAALAPGEPPPIMDIAQLAADRIRQNPTEFSRPKTPPS